MAGEVIVRRQLKRRQVLAFFSRLAACQIGMEADVCHHTSSFELLAQLGEQ